VSHAPNAVPLLNYVLSEDAGIIYASTNVGMIAAIGADDGEPLWLRTYDRVLAEGPAGAMALPAPNPAMLWQESLFITPDGSTDVMCLDATDGRLVWKTPRPAGSRLLAVTEAGAYLTGDRLWRVKLENGVLDPNFGKELSAGVGQGVVASDVIFWPTAGEILIVDRTTGAPTSQALALPAIGGANLLIAKSSPGAASRTSGDYYVVAVGSTHLTAYRRTNAAADDSSNN
jgi:outer membrane protein assembly factor BamB